MRVRLCKDKGKLMSAWMYELVKLPNTLPYYKSSEKLVQDRNIVLHNGDFNFILLLIMVDDSCYLLEY